VKSTISAKTGDALLKIARNTINNFPVQNSRSEMLISEQEFTLPEPVSVYICLWHQGKIRGFGSSHYKPLKSGVH
jgi:hypothetical protein